ncbi:MAG: hypothetical protein HY960_13795 [Ignavibacteriae bacterium]|nr:hypothetical protein [Ignavibacteriota bacterium]
MTGCEKRFESIDEYEKYVKADDSPFRQSVVQNGVKVTVQYLPTDAMMLRKYREHEEQKKKLVMSVMDNEEKRKQLFQLESEVSNQRAMYDNSLYFVLTIGYEDGKRDIEYESMKAGFQHYSAWLNKLLFSMQEYIYIETPSGDEVPLSLYNMERTYGMTKEREYLLLFPRTFNERDVLSKTHEWLNFHIEEFGCNTGSLNVQFTLPLPEMTLAVRG